MPVCDSLKGGPGQSLPCGYCVYPVFQPRMGNVTERFLYQLLEADTSRLQPFRDIYGHTERIQICTLLCRQFRQSTSSGL